MFSVYAVRVVEGVKHRHFLNTLSSLDEAKHLANCATLGNASYAYVKDTTGGTVFYLSSLVDYQPLPIQPSQRPKLQEAEP